MDKPPVHARPASDRGAMLPLAMVFTIILGAVVAGIASFAAAGLRHVRVVQDRADRLAAADGGMRYMIEKLKLRQTLCATAAATNGYTIVVPPSINAATIRVTCDRIGTLISDIQSWALVVTGQGVPNGSPIFETQGGNGLTKTFGGPVFMSDPARLNVGAPAEIKDGDLWYTGTSCPFPATPPTIPNLTFTPPFLRGPLCTLKTWDQLFTAPTLPPMPSAINPAPVTTPNGCTVFFPGKYTTPPAFGSQNYLVAGDYYFEDVYLDITGTVIGGFADGTNGDGQFLTATQCNNAASLYPGTGSGATIILGGTSKIYVDNKGGLEVLRRRQGTKVVSVQAVDPANATGGYKASSIDYASGQNIYESKPGNNSDVATHGLWWTPRGSIVLGNVTNTANGQFLGGLVGAYVKVQASASVNALNIRVETSPATARWLLISTATKNGASTAIRAVVEYQPDTAFLAINSWRVS
jgi:hypothetical protein